MTGFEAYFLSAAGGAIVKMAGTKRRKPPVRRYRQQPKRPSQWARLNPTR